VFLLILGSLHGQVSHFKINYFDPIVTSHGNSSILFQEDLSAFKGYPQNENVDTRIIIFWDTTLNHNSANFQNATRLINKYLVGKETNVSTAVYLFQISNDVFWKDLVAPVSNDKGSNAKVKPGKLATHLSALVLSDSDYEMNEREKHFLSSKRSTQEHTLRFYTTENLKRSFLFMEKERYGASCLLNEDSLLITALAQMYNKDLVLERSSNDRDSKIKELSEELSRVQNEFTKLRDSLKRKEPRLPYRLRLINSLHSGRRTSFQLPNDQHIDFRGVVYNSGFSAGYIWRNYCFNVGISSFTGNFSSIGKMDWSIVTKESGYSRISNISAYNERIDLKGMESQITVNRYLFKNIKQLSIFSGLTMSSISSAYYKASAEEWSILRMYDNYPTEVTDIPNLGLMKDSVIYDVGKIEYEAAFSVPIGFSYEYEVSKRWEVAAFVSRNLAIRHWKTSKVDNVPYESLNDTGSVVQWASYMPIYSWRLGFDIIFNL
jgi:hypothetical protein